MMPDQFLEVNVEASRTALAAIDTHQLLYLLVEVKPSHPEKFHRTPLNLSLVVDRSTSMRGRRLASVRSAATMIVEKLSSEDSLSVIAFSDRASVIVPAGRLKDDAQVLHKIRQIEAFGGTEAFQGLEAGYKELRRVSLAKHTNHLILLTDGHTYGDTEACLGLVRAGARDGISLSAFGIGREWNERFLDQLAAISGGETSYIATSSQVVQTLQSCIKGLGAVYAQNVRLAREFPGAFDLVSAFRVGPSAQPLGTNGRELRLGNVEGTVPLTLLLEFAVKPQMVGTELPLFVNLTADIPSESARNYQVQARHNLSIVANEPEDKPSEKLLAAVQAWNLHQMNDNVWSDIEQGNVQRAKTRMQLLTKRLMETGHTELAQQFRTETERLSTGDISLDGRKELTYGTRALVTQTMHLKTIDDETL
ncbi:MAG: VWA domain-containing protein [Chloroflexota bacterium]|nr:MAG: VWA domain-containing protein [Chloroflexota bacterium]